MSSRGIHQFNQQYNAYGHENTEQELAQNRGGTLSARQQAWGRKIALEVARGGVTGLQLLALFGGTFLLPVVLIVLKQTGNFPREYETPATIAIVVVAVLVITAALWYLQSDRLARRGLAHNPYAQAMLADVEAGRVEALDGTIEWAQERYEARAPNAKLTAWAHRGANPVVGILTPPGRYRLYALPTSRLVVAYELRAFDKEAYAKTLATVLQFESNTQTATRSVEGPARVRLTTDEQSESNALFTEFEVGGQTFQAPASAMGALVPGLPHRVHFTEEKGQRRVVRIELLA